MENIDYKTLIKLVEKYDEEALLEGIKEAVKILKDGIGE